MAGEWPPTAATTDRLSDEQRLAWLRLIRSENVGPATFRNLVAHYGSPSAALDALPELSQRGGAKRRIRICAPDDAFREMERSARYGARLIALAETDYPPLLRHIDAPPPLLSVIGSPRILQRNAIAIVGSRNASIAGCKFAGQLGHDLGLSDYAIVSGLARGIDTAAHQAGLDTGTIAVLAGGIDHVYPPENASLYQAIAELGGAVISEMPFGWSPRSRDFPRRNRLISGVSHGVVLVEATRRSGSLHTARFALEQGREVFAAPGSPLDPRAEGCNRLIRDGATLALEAQDVIAALKPIVGGGAPTALEAEEQEAATAIAEPDDQARATIIDALGATPVAVDDVIRHTNLPAAAVHIVLTELELAGRLERHGNQTVSIVF